MSASPILSSVAENAAPAGEALRCASCGTELHGSFCHACGEKRIDHHDYALGHWLEHTVDAFTHFDLKVPRSLWSLLRTPGRMTADVLAGRRVKWAKPVQVFLIANLIYYALAKLLHLSTFETPLYFHHRSFYRTWAQQLTAADIAHAGLTEAAYAAHFNALAHTLAKTLVIFFVPVLAGAFALLTVRAHRYFLEHLTSSLHFVALLLLTLPLPFPLIWGAFRLGLLGPGSGDASWTLATAFLIGAYAATFMRRVYGGSKTLNILRGTAIVFVFYVALIFLYRPLLFVIVRALL